MNRTTADSPLHLDRRAEQLLELAGTADPDTLLSPKQLAEWLGVTVQTVKVWRMRGVGPEFHRPSQNRIRYRRRDVLRWLDQRSHRCTSEYTRG